MTKKELFLDFIGKLGLQEDTPVVADYISKAFPVKAPKVVKHECLFVDNLSEEEVEEFLESPEEWLEEGDLPSFSFDKGCQPEAVEGEEFFARINGKYYAFTLHEGECVEASWSGSIYRTEVRDFKAIPDEELGNYNFVEYTFMSRR